MKHTGKCIYKNYFAEYSMNICALTNSEANCKYCNKFQNSSGDLKPCPFCGGKAKIYLVNYDLKHKIFCTKCGSSTEYFKDVNKLIKLWNNRV